MSKKDYARGKQAGFKQSCKLLSDMMADQSKWIHHRDESGEMVEYMPADYVRACMLVMLSQSYDSRNNKKGGQDAKKEEI